MLAEQCDKYEEMVEFLEEEFKKREIDISPDERNLLSIAYKNNINNTRSALRTIMAYESKEKKKENSSFLPYILFYKKEISNKLLDQYQRTIKFVEDYLINKAKDNEAIVFYKKMIGDYNRYIAESDFIIKNQATNNALKYYEEAKEKAEELPILNPIKLGLYINLSVFYYDIINDHKKAIDITKSIIEEAEKELPYIDEDADENRDTISIYNLLKENLEDWSMKCEN